MGGLPVFEKALVFELSHDAGGVDVQHNLGGCTQYGICRRRYPYEDLDALTCERLALMFMRDLRELLNLDSQPPCLTIATFDSGVNTSLGRDGHFLQTGLNTVLPAGDRLTMDGKVGPETAAAIRRVAGMDSAKLESALAKLLMAHLSSYAKLVARSPHIVLGQDITAQHGGGH